METNLAFPLSRFLNPVQVFVTRVSVPLGFCGPWISHSSRTTKREQHYQHKHPSSNQIMGWYQPHIPLTPEGTDLKGQTIIITGATAGLGYETSLQLLRLKASTIILGVRNTKRGDDARQSLLADSEVRRVNPQAKVKVSQLDLVDERSVVGFANRVLSEEARLDVLLLNAGINVARWEQSPSGHEM